MMYHVMWSAYNSISRYMNLGYQMHQIPYQTADIVYVAQVLHIAKKPTSQSYIAEIKHISVQKVQAVIIISL